MGVVAVTAVCVCVCACTLNAINVAFVWPPLLGNSSQRAISATSTSIALSHSHTLPLSHPLSLSFTLPLFVLCLSPAKQVNLLRYAPTTVPHPSHTISCSCFLLLMRKHTHTHLYNLLGHFFPRVLPHLAAATAVTTSRRTVKQFRLVFHCLTRFAFLYA